MIFSEDYKLVVADHAPLAFDLDDSPNSEVANPDTKEYLLVNALPSTSFNVVAKHYDINVDTPLLLSEDTTNVATFPPALAGLFTEVTGAKRLLLEVVPPVESSSLALPEPVLHFFTVTIS